MLDLSRASAPQIIVGFPYPGGCCLPFGTAASLYRASLKFDCGILASEGSWDGFNNLLSTALNMHAAGKATHFAMLHADIVAEQGWVDVLWEEICRLGADMVSAVVPIKDHRGVTSCGIIDRLNRWHPLKRFTMREVCELPETFDAGDAGYPDGGLLHNDGCMMIDLSAPLFSECDEQGVLQASFDFPRQIFWDRENNCFSVRGESEDWYFSRKLYELGAKTYLTRKVKLMHVGHQSFTNQIPWGTYAEGDEDTAHLWAAGKT